MSRVHLIALGGGVLSALFYLSVKLGSPGAIVLAYLAQFPLFLVGLWLGVVPAAIASGVAAVSVGAGANLNASGLYLLLAAGPVLIIVRQGLLSRPGATAGQVVWYPPGHLAACLAAYGLVILGGASLFLVGAPGGLEGAARAYLNATLYGMAGPEVNLQLDAMIDSLVRLFPAAVVMTWTFMVVINATLAQRILARFDLNRRPSPKFADMTLPQWLTTGLVLCLLGAMLPGQFGLVAQNAAVIMAIPFFLLGLAMIHAISRRMAARGIFLVLFYIILLISVWPAVAVAGAGFVEPWLALRRRFGPPASGKEDE